MQETVKAKGDPQCPQAIQQHPFSLEKGRRANFTCRERRSINFCEAERSLFSDVAAPSASLAKAWNPISGARWRKLRSIAS
jgi:hypothetical protein